VSQLIKVLAVNVHNVRQPLLPFSSKPFITPKAAPILVKQLLSILPSVQPWATTTLLSVYMDLPVPYILYVWGHTIYGVISLSLLFSRFIHIIACIRILLFVAW
jgi:hypothetical protein